MGKRSGEQARRFTSTPPALLTSKCVRRCVDAGLLPPTIFRASGPTVEFGSHYYRERDLAKARAAPSRVILSAPLSIREPPPRGKPPRRERAIAKIDALMRLQRGYCYLCCQPFYASRPPTLEHVTPKARRGQSRGNLLLAHSDCNSRKADRRPYPCELIYLAAINYAAANRRFSFDRTPPPPSES